MTPSLDIYFEIRDGGDFIRIAPIKPYDEKSENDWDKNWIRTEVAVKGGAFTGRFFADFLTTDFELLKRDFKKLNQDFNGVAKLEPLERQLILNVTGDGLGHFEVRCVANDHANTVGTLSFTLTFDQTELNRLVNELDKITKAFPIRGDFSIRNE